MIESYFKLVGLPEDATTQDVEEMRLTKQREYGGTLPGEFAAPFELLSNAGLRSIYAEVLELSRSMRIVERPDVNAAREFAEKHHFLLQVVAEPDQVRYVNVGTYDAPPPPVPSPTADDSANLALPPGGPNSDYFAVLGVDPTLPAWKLQKALYGAVEELKDAYGQELPGELEPVIMTTVDEAARTSYMDLLQKAETGQAVEYANASAAALAARAAEALHFHAIRESDSCLSFKNVGVPNPPMPPPPPSLSREPRTSTQARVPADQGQAPPAQQSRKDMYGRVDGVAPPIMIGPRVYKLQIGRCVLESAVKQKDSIVFNWVQQAPGQPANRATHRDFNALVWQDGFIQVGRDYFHVVLVDLETGRSTTEAFCGINTELYAPLIMTTGIWQCFPWHSRYLKSGVTWDRAAYYYQRDNPGRPVPPHEHFGPDGWTDETQRAFAKYIEEVVYWGRAYIDNFKIPPPEIRERARVDVRWILENLAGMSKRQVRKLGY